MPWFLLLVISSVVLAFLVPGAAFKEKQHKNMHVGTPNPPPWSLLRI